MFSRMRVVERVCLSSLAAILCSTALSPGSVTGTYYGVSTEASASIQPIGWPGYTEDYDDQNADSFSGPTPVSLHVEAKAGPDDYVWPTNGYARYPSGSADASADFLSLNVSCDTSDGWLTMSGGYASSAYSEAHTEARFEINQTDNWTLMLSGQGNGPWINGDIGAQLFDSNMSLVQEWDKTWTAGGLAERWFTLSSTDTFACGTYYLHLTAWGSACATYGEPDHTRVWINAQVMPIPAPGALLLAGIGLGCLRRLRQNRMS
jgi:hypothetical protein